MMRYFYLFILFFVLTPLSAKYFPDTLSQTSEISLLTVGPGSQDVASIFGHSGIRVKDEAQEFDVVFGYGTYDFDTPGFLLKFLSGKLLYSVSIGSFDGFMGYYDRSQRFVNEQILDLNPDEKNQYFDFLKTNYKKENRYYLYDFFFDNCATRIRDIFFEISDAQIASEIAHDKTFRDLLDEYLKPYPWTDFGIDLIIGSKADYRAGNNGAMFLPDYLSTGLDKMYIGGTSKKLSKEATTLLDFPPDKTQRVNWPLWVFMLFVVVFAFHLRATRNIKLAKTIYFIVGIAGVIVAIMWFATDHQACADNWNLLWANPLYLIPFFWKNTRSYLLVMAILVAISVVLIDVFQLQNIHSAVYPILLLIVMSGWRLDNNPIVLKSYH